MHLIPKDKKVTFYVVSLESDPESIIEPLHTFTETTGNQNLQFKIPDFLNYEECSVFAVVDLTGTYDLDGRTISEAQAAATNGEILFGRATPNVIFRNNTVVKFKFIGKAAGPSVSMISFTMPSIYEAGDFIYDIPPVKDVIIYSIASVPESDAKINADYTFSALTGVEEETTVCALPDELLDQNRYFFAVVILKDSFNLQGKTKAQIMDAIQKGTILFGQAKDLINDEIMSYSLYDGIEIDNFKFVGAPPDLPDGTITFSLPPSYETLTKDVKSIPKGKSVKFYALANTDAPLKADEIFTDKTGSGKITRPLPSRLFGRDYYFFAIVNLKDSFDLQNKNEDDVKDAIENGNILFGQAKDPMDEDVNKLYTLKDQIKIDNFKFLGI
jgi:hypothetical protein